MTAPEIPEAEKRLALKAALDSETFARSDQLRHFLSYIGEMAIAGRSREIAEYSIAVEALGRPPSFSPADDSSVRSRAYELRQKLERYYRTEAPDAPVRIELPKGSYVPRFHHRDRRELRAPAAEAAGLRAWRRCAWPALAGLAVAACAGAVWYLAGRVGARPAMDPILKQAWGPLAEPGSEVLISVGTTLHLVVRPYMSYVAEGLPKYPAPKELYPLFRQHRPLPEGTQLDMHPVDNSVQIGHLSAVVALAAVLNGAGAPFQVLPERSARVSALRGRNAILIGDPQNSEAAFELLDKAPLTIDYDPDTADLVVRDRRKAGPAGRVYLPRRGPDRRYTDLYGLLTVVPSPGTAGDKRTVVISGMTSVGAHGAAEFFASAPRLRHLLEKFRGRGLPGFPEAYQVVVHCRSNDTLLLSADYQAHEVIRY